MLEYTIMRNKYGWLKIRIGRINLNRYFSGKGMV
jgi:hypothetical protein